jgi:TolA-binding protein
MCKYFFVVLGLLLSLNLFAGKGEKAFEALNRYDFFKARDLFLKIEKKDPAVANFGLARIFIFEKNPYHDIDSARVRLLKAEELFYNLSEKERAKIEKKFPLDSTEIQVQKKLLGTLAFRFTQKNENTITGWTNFLELYSFAEEFAQATQFLHTLAYQEAIEKGTSKALDTFMENYPNAEQTVEAKRIYFEKQYQEQTREGSAKSYAQFIELFPNSPYVDEAKQKLFETYTKSGTLTSFLNFARKYPENPNAGKAWRKVAALYLTDEYSAQKLIEFRLDYPDYPFLSELVAEIEVSTEKFYPFESGGKYGFINAKGEIKIQATFDWVGEFNQGLAPAGTNDKAGYINKFGNWAIAAIYDEVEPFVNGFAIVEKNGLFGVVDRNGKAILPCNFNDVGNFSNGFFAVSNQENLYGYFDAKGKQVIDFKYDFASNFSQENLAAVSLKGKWGSIYFSEKMEAPKTVIPFEFDWVDSPREGFIRVRTQQKFGLFNTQGELVLKADYSGIAEPSEGRILVIDNKKLGYLNYYGKFSVEPNEESWPGAISTANFNKGVALSMQGGKFGYIDTLGNKVYARVFEDIGDFNLPLIAVKKRGKWGYADDNVRLAIPYNFDFASDFMGEIAFVSQKGAFYFIGKNGKPIDDRKFKSITPQKEHRYLIAELLEGGFVLLNLKAEPILGDETFDNIQLLDNELVLVKRNFRKAWFNLKQNTWVKKEEGLSF